MMSREGLALLLLRNVSASAASYLQYGADLCKLDHSFSEFGDVMFFYASVLDAGEVHHVCLTIEL